MFGCNFWLHCTALKDGNIMKDVQNKPMGMGFRLYYIKALFIF